MTSLGVSTLAPETLDQIFDLLTPDNLTSCALVCRRWSLLTTRPLWQKIAFAIHPDAYYNPFLESLQARRESISNFRWTKHLDVNFSFVGPRCKTPTLEDLSQTLVKRVPIPGSGEIPPVASVLCIAPYRVLWVERLADHTAL